MGTLVFFDLNQSGGIGLPYSELETLGGKGDGRGRVGFKKDETKAV
jgi:hypothetical protein